MSLLYNRLFDTKKQLYDAAQIIAKAEGYCVTTKNSIKRHMHLQCRCGGQPKNCHGLTEETRKIKRDSWRKECPFLIKARPTKSGCWEAWSINDQHNHDMVDNYRIFHQHRKLTEDQFARVLEMIQAKATPSNICDALRDMDGNQIMIPKDVSNIKNREAISENSNGCNMAYMRQYLHARGYQVRYQYNSNKQLTSLLFAHPSCIKNAQRFSEVVIMDATYKTNMYKMPYVNVVGVSNVGSKSEQLKTFAIAGAWISNETKESYTWVAEELHDLIWKPVDKVPGVIVTDYDPSLVGAIKTTYRDTTFMLCTVHIRKNFQKNCLKGFDGDVEKHKALLKAVDGLIRSDNESSYQKAKSDFLEVANTSSKSTEIVKYLDR